MEKILIGIVGVMISGGQLHASLENPVIPLFGKPNVIGKGYVISERGSHGYPGDVGRVRPDTCVSGTQKTSEEEGIQASFSDTSSDHGDVFLANIPEPILAMINPLELVSYLRRQTEELTISYTTSVLYEGRTRHLNDVKWLGDEGKDCGNSFVGGATIGAGISLIHRVMFHDKDAKKEFGALHERLSFASNPTEEERNKLRGDLQRLSAHQLKSIVVYVGGEQEAINKIVDESPCTYESLDKCYARNGALMKYISDVASNLGTPEAPAQGKLISFYVQKNITVMPLE